MANKSSISKNDIVTVSGGYKSPKPRKFIKKISQSKRKQYAEYYPKAKSFLADNPKCLLCVTRGMKPNDATEVHHVYLRTGKRLLLDERGWLPSCRSCRDYPHESAKRGEERGILARGPSRNSWEALDKDAAEGTLPEMLYLTTVNNPKKD
jgi:hypothetical protein